MHELYNERRAELLLMIDRKISYKERLIQKQDEEFTEQLNKQIANAEKEVNTLLSFVLAFDKLVELMENEIAITSDELHKANRQNAILSELLNVQNERVEAWSNTAFKLADDYIKRQLDPSKYANA